MTRLRQRMLEDMQIRNLASSTQEKYIWQVARYARHFGKCPSNLGPQEIRDYQVYLLKKRQASPSVLTAPARALAGGSSSITSALTTSRRIPPGDILLSNPHSRRPAV